MKWLHFLNNNLTKQQFRLGSLFAIIYSLYIIITRDADSLSYMLPTLVIILIIIFIVFDCRRGITFLQSKEVRIIPIHELKLVFINFVLSSANFALYSICISLITSIGHYYVLSTVNIPIYQFFTLIYTWYFFISCYICLQFLLLLTKVIGQNYLYKISKYSITILFTIIFGAFTGLNYLIMSLITPYIFLFYITVLMISTFIGSAYLVKNYIEGN